MPPTSTQPPETQNGPTPQPQPTPAPLAQTSMPQPQPTPTPVIQSASQQQQAGAQTFANPELPQEPPHHTNATNIVLQWLTYAFWGWTVLITSILTFAVLDNILADSETDSFIIYAVAATLVLLPISIVCDFFYSKQEPEKKTGAASIVMVIHAVLFALFGIGTLIWAVFAIVSLLTSSTDSSTTTASLYSSAIVFVLYVATFLRTLNPSKFSWIRRAYMIFMVVIVGIIALMGILGPAANERATRTDRLINDNLYSLTDAINDYARDNNSLPDDLSKLTLEGDEKKLVDDNLVKYEANTLSPSSVNNYDDFYGSSSSISSSVTYYYKLCVDYKKEKKSKYSSYDRSSTDKNGYTSYISTSSYPAGEYCYKLKTTDY